MDVSQALAVALLALIAVMPEYAVSAVFALQAGHDPAIAQSGYAIANVTGSNRLLIGIGWPTVVFLFWLRSRRAGQRVTGITIDPGQATEITVQK